MANHKFKIGQTVEYLPDKIQIRPPAGSFRIVRLLPALGQDNQYRIKNASEAYERIAQESQLTVAAAP